MSASCSLQNKVMARRDFMSSVDFSKELRTSYAQKRSRKLKRKLVKGAHKAERQVAMKKAKVSLSLVFFE